MDTSTSMFTETFRSIHTIRAEEPGRAIEMGMIISDTCQFALQQQQLNGRTRIDYRTVNRAQRWGMAPSPGVEIEVPSMPELNTELFDAQAMERSHDLRDQMNVRSVMLLTKLGRQNNVDAVGLIPPLWFVGVADLERWLTAEEICDVSVHEAVEYTVEDDSVPAGGDRVEHLEIGLILRLRIISATRQPPENGAVYTIEWRVEAMKAERVFPDPQAGIDRVDDRGNSQGVASFDASGVLISLTGTGSSRSDMTVNSNFKGHDGKALAGTISDVNEHEISVLRV